MHLLVKPAGPDCNISCPRCFYKCKEALFSGGAHRMKDEVAEKLLAATSVTFQGGEPLLMGLDFFKRFADRGVECSIQTNGTLVTPEIAKFLAKEKWLVGISFDGPKPIHDRTRDNSYDAARRGYDLLMEAGAEVNVLTLVTSANVSDPEGIYRFVRDDLGAKFHQYIECTEDISGGEWADFLIRVFGEWERLGDQRRISVRNFDSVFNWMAAGMRCSCTSSPDCRNYLVVEHTGDVYPCDFFVDPEWKLGNILRDSLADLVRNPRYAEFGRRKAQMPMRCRTCRWLEFCNGDCVKNRLGGDATRLCPGIDRFFAHAVPRLARILEEMRRDG
ncbi:MAG: radical SAM protein [Kiritimatiellae bacterium]|nr:radical SAM protein [Kiritimatiellia bacterium]